MHPVHLLRMLLHSVKDLLQQIFQPVQLLRDSFSFDPVIQIPQMTDVFHSFCHNTVQLLLSAALLRILCVGVRCILFFFLLTALLLLQIGFLRLQILTVDHIIEHKAGLFIIQMSVRKHSGF